LCPRKSLLKNTASFKKEKICIPIGFMARKILTVRERLEHEKQMLGQLILGCRGSDSMVRTAMTRYLDGEDIFRIAAVLSRSDELGIGDIILKDTVPGKITSVSLHQHVVELFERKFGKAYHEELAGLLRAGEVRRR